MIAYGQNGIVKQWDVASGEVISEFVAHEGMRAFSMSHDGNRVAFGGLWYDPEIPVYDTRTGAVIQMVAASRRWVHTLALTADGNSLFIGSFEGKLSLFDIASGRETRVFTGHRRCLNALALSPDEKQIVAGDEYGQVIVWDVESTQPLVTLVANGPAVTSLDWSSDGKQIAAGYSNGAVQIWTLPVTATQQP